MNTLPHFMRLNLIHRFPATWVLVAALVLLSTSASQADKTDAAVIYGTRDGVPLIMDVFIPSKPNGAGILHIQSGGWYSPRKDPAQMIAGAKGLMAKGFTVFTIWHSNPPKYKVPDAVEDVRRAARFIHANAARWGVDPNRLAAVGGSAGGHLALMLATTGDDGNASAKDLVERSSSRVATAVAINPPSDLRGWTTAPPGAIAAVPALKAPLLFDASLEETCSPIVHVDAGDASIYLIHGSKDELVSVEYSKAMFAEMKSRKAPGDLFIMEGAGHAVQPQYAVPMAVAMVNWLTKQLGVD